MATCYRCGRPIHSEDFKLHRRVKTGESIIRRYPHPQISALRTTYGIRLVCLPCAKTIDWEQARREWLKYLELSLALLLAVTLAIRFLG